MSAVVLLPNHNHTQRRTIIMANAPPIEPKTQSGGLTLRMGNTTYVLNLHFSEDSKLTLEEKIKKMIRRDIQLENF